MPAKIELSAPELELLKKLLDSKYCPLPCKYTKESQRAIESFRRRAKAIRAKLEAAKVIARPRGIHAQARARMFDIYPPLEHVAPKTTFNNP